MNTNLDKTINIGEYKIDYSGLNAVFYKDIYGKYIYCNNKFCNYLGLTSNQIIGKTDKDIYEYIKHFNILKNQDEEVIKYKVKRTYQAEIKVENEYIKHI